MIADFILIGSITIDFGALALIFHGQPLLHGMLLGSEDSISSETFFRRLFRGSLIPRRVESQLKSSKCQTFPKSYINFYRTWKGSFRRRNPISYRRYF